MLTLVIILSAVLLILYNARENVSYFYTPSEIDKSDIIINKIIRIGGFVENDSFNKISSSSFKFKITDEKASILVIFEGILPDLFREGQGAVIEGAFVDKNIFNATNVFAKHDENYMPASIKEDLKDTGYWNKKYK
jgi:cytochrome c-type biogenesis protein CcmE